MTANFRRTQPHRPLWQETNVETPRWDAFLAALGCSEEDAVRRKDCREWVRCHQGSCFIPERVLDACGCYKETL